MSGDGLPNVNMTENCPEIVHRILCDKLKLRLPVEDISSAYRIGRRPTTQGPDKRSLYVKLLNCDIKNSIITSCKKMKPDKLYINENLTPGRAKVMSMLRKMKREVPDRITGVGSRDGRVFAWLKPPNSSSPASRVSVGSLSDVEKLCGDFGLDMSDFRMNGQASR